MAALQNIRDKFGILISVIIALALLSFIIDPTTLDSALSSLSSKYNVGQINGKAIPYTDYQEEVERYNTIHEMVTGTSVKNDEQQEQIRNSAWQNLLDKYMFIKKAKAAGINVGKDELLALTHGEMSTPVLSQNYAFADESGQYDPNILADFVANVDSDPSGNARLYWNFLQNSISTQQYYAKYGSLFTQSDVQNPLQLQNTIAENNTTANVEFVMIPFGFGKDSTITVSGNEIEKYYRAHKKDYKQKASRDIEYVVFEVKPSADDIAATNDAVSELYDEFATTDNVKNFLTKNSDRSYSETWYKEGELSTVSQAVSDFVDGAKPGDVSTILSDGNVFYGVRVLAASTKPEEVNIRVVSAGNATAVNDSLVNVLRLAEPFPMKRNGVIAGLEALLDAPLNTPRMYTVGAYGNLIAEVVSKGEMVPVKQVAIFQKEAFASKETFNKYYSQANKFATLAAGGLDNYHAAVDTMGVYSHKQPNVLESTSSFGAIDNAKELTRWAFDNKPGKVSNIITVNNNFFFVAAVTGAHKEGYATVKEVAAQINNTLYSEKLAEARTAAVAEKIAGLDDLNAIAEAFGTTVSTQEDVTFSSMRGSSLDPAFTGAIFAAPEGKIVGPVKGSFANYVFKVTGRDTGAFYTEDDAKNYQAQMNQYKSQMIIPVMMELCDVKDNRARFY